MIIRKIKIVFLGVISFFLLFSFLDVRADYVQRGTGEVMVEYTPNKEEQKNEYKGYKVLNKEEQKNEYKGYKLLNKHTSNLPQTGEQDNLLEAIAFSVGLMLILIFIKDQRKNDEN